MLRCEFSSNVIDRDRAPAIRFRSILYTRLSLLYDNAQKRNFKNVNYCRRMGIKLSIELLTV